MKLVAGNEYEVTVEKILPFGVIVRINDNSEETFMIHISNVSDGYVKYIEEYFSVGKTYRAIAIEGKVKPVELSTKESDFQKYSGGK